MELSKAVLDRRSCRSYDKEKKVSEEQIREILDYSTYIPNEADKIMGDILGFGRSMD